MKRKITIILTVTLFAAATAGFFYWRSDRRRLNVMLDKAERTVAKRPASTPHDGVLKYSGLDGIFAETLTVSGDMPYSNRELSIAELRGFLAMLHRHIKSLTIRTDNRIFKISSDTADFAFDTEFTLITNSGQTDRDVSHVTGKAVKKENKWLITELHVKSVVKMR